MAERKRRGLGRGLGALINSDTENPAPSGATAHAVPPVEPEIDPEPIDVSHETERIQGDRPIDVFFSAKSHLETQRVSRETGTQSKATTARARTAPRRTNGNKRAEMPDVLGQRSVSRETPQVEGAEFRSLPVGSIRPNPRQPREVFDEEDMAELVHSVREIGVLQPIVVRPVEEGHYELIMGERRWRASQAASRETIPAVVRNTADEDLLRDALLENIHRSELNPLEEAAAYQQLLDDFSISQEELSKRIGRSRPQISNTLRLMRLPAAAQRRVAAGVLSSGHARALLALETEEQMEELAQRIVAEGLSVRSAEEEASIIKKGGQKESVSRGTNRLPASTQVQELEEYAEALIDRLDTQVKISMGAKKGRIAIDFASVEDLERILQEMGLHIQS
ncbi:ParB/RepB/Spo0J family partition protein [Nesterenkonia sp. MY13]|uniref:ParB/RepB/Spo0J family partition protein n=1 Tax=Nesterenkonia sedimenti TaxID=1463632 RepID=A0A7X8TKU9_9MICC|nr:ParB/RepB/Spo0J family partition protein [Nesterenkonia sedimenti]NLS10440.1 ParB/RepB/Spo0J family partition protein [Nesterenkonia sedimenti]